MVPPNPTMHDVPESKPPNDPTTDHVLSEVTSLHIERAATGLPESVTWIIQRFTPYLRLQARHRLKGLLQASYDEDDLIQEVWLKVLPHLKDLKPRDGRWTPVLLAYVGTTCLRHARYLYRKQIVKERSAAPQVEIVPDLHEFSADVTNALSQAVRHEASKAVFSCMGSLSDRERDTFIMRAMEGLSNQEVANRFDENKQTASMRYSRILRKLRSCLADGVLDELEASH